MVDATQGVEAQTLANVYLALDHNHEIIPVLNKIDLPSSDVERVKSEIEEDIGLDCSKALPVSAKTGDGVPDVLEAIVERLPAPEGNPNAPLKALIFDSWYDSYQGVVVMFRIMDGTLRKGDKIELFATKKTYEVIRLGVFSPESRDMDQLSAGEVGFLCGNIKELGDASRRHHHAGGTPLRRGRARLQGSEGGGLLRPLPVRSERLRAAQVRAGKTPAQRRGLLVGTGNLAGPRLRLPLRLPRPPAHGNHSGTPRTRIPGGPHRHGTLGHLPGGDDGRKTTEIDNPSKLPDPARITNLYEPTSASTSMSRATMSAT